MSDPLAQAANAHREALAAQEAMREASRRRGEAVRAAQAAGYTGQQIADALGVARPRVQAMARQ